MNNKVTPQHLQRSAYLYVRQSTLRQVKENTESTHRQYGLKQKALSLGWAEDQIVVIDCDLGQSGATTAERGGFQRLVTEVGLGRAGIVMGLEVSRLARNCADWHRLLELCAMTHTLILDEEGTYDPSSFNDRLLLGLKGTMSEAELHLIRARMRGGMLNKAQRGEFRMALPVGFVYDDDRVMLDPDRQVQTSVRYFFETFNRTGSANATVRQFRKEQVQFPRHESNGHGAIVWKPLTHLTALRILRNPRYTGAYVYGFSKTWKGVDGKEHRKRMPPDQWQYVIKNAHEGYLSWQQFEQNAQQLTSNAQAHGFRPHGNCPREGPALLQGIALCGRCGLAMGVHYHKARGQEFPIYTCQNDSQSTGQRVCQMIPGKNIDEAIAALIIESITPSALNLVLSVQKEVEARWMEADGLRRQQVERAQYESDQARLRYMRVDPNNRLVADNVEKIWNNKLKALAQAQEEYERAKLNDQQKLTQEQRQRIRELTEDFPKVWRDPKTADRDRKRMLRLIIEDVTLKRTERRVAVGVRFRGGTIKQFEVTVPLPAPDARRTPMEVVCKIDELLEEVDETEAAARLNAMGLRTGCNLPFSRELIIHLCKRHKLRARAQRLKDKGFLSAAEMTAYLGVSCNALLYWRKLGLVKGFIENQRMGYFYEKPSPEIRQEINRRRKSDSLESPSLTVV
jgi:DNA invertase Pin-like site-specific DNA recombinase